MNNISDLYYSYLESPIGLIEICANSCELVSIYFSDSQPGIYPSNAITEEALAQLKAYFARKLSRFELPLGAVGTDFQQQVWQALATIPYGSTCSYADIANKLHNPKAVRAVGAANGKNPLSIVIPCHRVIGKNGTLTGYAGGLARKSWLLDFEQNS